MSVTDMCMCLWVSACIYATSNIKHQTATQLNTRPCQACLHSQLKLETITALSTSNVFFISHTPTKGGLHG